jgi:hypothetical protein
MADGQVQETREGERWRRGPELPADVFGVLHKPNRAINPISIVATADRDGTLRTAPPSCCGGLQSPPLHLRQSVSRRTGGCSLAGTAKHRSACAGASEVGQGTDGHGRASRHPGDR